MVPFAYPLVYMKTLFKLFVVLTFPINNLNFVLIYVNSILPLWYCWLCVCGVESYSLAFDSGSIIIISYVRFP